MEEDGLIAQLRDARTGATIGAPMRHDGRIWQAAFSADELRIVTASRDGTARVWDARTGTALGTPMRHDDEVHTAEFSSDGRRIVTGSADRTARLWNAATGAPIGAPMEHDSSVTIAKFSPDGAQVMTSDGFHLYFWDAVTGNPIRTIERYGALSLRAAQITRNGSQILTVSDNGYVEFLNMENGLRAGPSLEAGYLGSAVLTSDERFVVTSSGGAIALWNVNWPAAPHIIALACLMLPEVRERQLLASLGLPRQPITRANVAAEQRIEPICDPYPPPYDPARLAD